MNVLELMGEIEKHHIIGIVGMLGDGKTISGISILSVFKLLNDSINNPKRILSNIPLKIDYELLEFYDQLDDCKDTLIFLDEIHQNADSRTWHKKGNFFTTGITMDVRKFRNKLIWTSQYANQVEKRIRQLTTLYIKPEKLHRLIFNLNLAEIIVEKDYEHIKVNLEAFKDIYDTHYKPIPLITLE